MKLKKRRKKRARAFRVGKTRRQPQVRQDRGRHLVALAVTLLSVLGTLIALYEWEYINPKVDLLTPGFKSSMLSFRIQNTSFMNLYNVIGACNIHPISGAGASQGDLEFRFEARFRCVPFLAICRRAFTHRFRSIFGPNGLEWIEGNGG
jgi:hypothetical protein